MNGFPGVSGAGVSGQAQPREGSMTDALAQFDPIIKQLEEHRDHLAMLLGRLFGPHPTPVPDGRVDQAPPPSMIGQTNVRARTLASLVNEAHELGRRLDSVL